MNPVWINLGVIMLVVLTVLVALLALYLVWRNGYSQGWRASRANPPRCAACGYNLSGLTVCRCPECGREYRLEQLWSTPIMTSNQTNTSGPEKLLAAKSVF